MLSGRDLCDEVITRPEESYRLWCVVVCDLETSRIGAPYIYIYIYDISSLRVNIVRLYTASINIGNPLKLYVPLSLPFRRSTFFSKSLCVLNVFDNK